MITVNIHNQLFKIKLITDSLLALKSSENLIASVLAQQINYSTILSRFSPLILRVPYVCGEEKNTYRDAAMT